MSLAGISIVSDETRQGAYTDLDIIYLAQRGEIQID